MITTFYPPYHFGGDAVFVYRLSNELAERGHTVHVIFSVDAYRLLAGEPVNKNYPNHPNITLHPLDHTIPQIGPLLTHQLGAPVLDLGMIQEILSIGFDVIHYHNISLVGGPAILGMGSGVKLYTLHEYWLICPTHVLFKNLTHACDKPECLPCIISYRRPPQLWRYTGAIERAVRHVDMFIAPSQFVADKHKEYGLNIPTVHLPYFLAEPEPIDVSPAAEPYFLFVGRLERLKGLHTLINVFRQFKKTRLLIAGTGQDEDFFRELASDLDHVTFLGHQSGTRLQTLYAQATALIMSSITFEVLGQVALEAFTQHTPVIVNNIGGMPELVATSGAGYVYDNDEELIAAMEALLDPVHRQQLGQRAYEAYRTHYTPDVHIEQYMGLI